MRRLLWLIVMFTGLIFFGCEPSEQPKSQAPAAQHPTKGEEVTKAEDVKAVIPAVEAAQEAAEKAQDKVVQTDKMTQTALPETGKQAPIAVEDTVKTAEKTLMKEAERTVAVVPSAQQASIPQEIILEASYGNITFPHAMHASSYECKICHGDGAPAAFGITKDVAHKLCKDCHKNEGVGPTGCKGCHQK